MNVLIKKGYYYGFSKKREYYQVLKKTSCKRMYDVYSIFFLTKAIFIRYVR